MSRIATERQFNELNFLAKHGRVKAQELMNEFQVSRATIERDMFDLSFLFPIRSFTTEAGGFELMPSYFMNNQFITNKELNLICKALEMLNTDETKALIEKLSPSQKNKGAL